MKHSEFFGMILAILFFSGVGYLIQQTQAASPVGIVEIHGNSGPGLLVQHDAFQCREWGHLQVCATNDISWRIDK